MEYAEAETFMLETYRPLIGSAAPLIGSAAALIGSTATLFRAASLLIPAAPALNGMDLSLIAPAASRNRPAPSLN